MKCLGKEDWPSVSQIVIASFSFSLVPLPPIICFHSHSWTWMDDEETREEEGEGAELGNAIHNPSLMPTTITSDAAGGFQWTDLATAGCLKVQ